MVIVGVGACCASGDRIRRVLICAIVMIGQWCDRNKLRLVPIVRSKDKRDAGNSPFRLVITMERNGDIGRRSRIQSDRYLIQISFAG